MHPEKKHRFGVWHAGSYQLNLQLALVPYFIVMDTNELNDAALPSQVCHLPSLEY